MFKEAQNKMKNIIHLKSHEKSDKYHRFHKVRNNNNNNKHVLWTCDSRGQKNSFLKFRKFHIGTQPSLPNG